MIKHAYIHIPFCLRKCHYCSFVSGFNVSKKDIYIDALLKEIKNRYNKEQLSTIYFGGGTPSLLEAKDIEKILNELNFENNAEITIEANPETIEEKKFKDLYSIGINRVSLGVQTFNNNILKIIGRNHNENSIYKSIDTITNAEIENISIDLIYGLPTQTLSLFKNDLEKAISLKIKHISTYGLKIEEDSFFYKNPPDKIPNDEKQAQCYIYLCKFLKENDFEHYEISNFAKKGYHSKHNLCYWENKNYYGFGLNASGYESSIRYKNISDFNEYIKNPLSKEEEIFLSLRLKKGIKKDKISSKYKNIIKKYEQLELLEIRDNHLRLTDQGFLVSNEIMSEFIEFID